MDETPRRRWSLHVTISMLLVGILVLVVGGAVTITLVVRGRSLKATAAAIQIARSCLVMRVDATLIDDDVSTTRYMAIRLSVSYCLT